MTTDSDIWIAFAKTFGMLFLILALLVLGFYLIRRFSGMQGGRGSRDLIKVLAVHHLSPKERLVLVNVQEKTLLIGVTPQQITHLAVLDQTIDPAANEPAGPDLFSGFLSRALTPKGAKQEKREEGGRP